MTTIIGVEHGGKVYMGADSEVDFGWSRSTLTNRKISKFPGLLIGVAGELRTSNIIQHYLQPPIQEADETDEHYVIVSLIQAMRKCIKDAGFLTVENSKETPAGSVFMIAYKCKLYRVGSQFDVGRYSSGIASIGTGSEYALGALHALYSGRKVSVKRLEQQIKKALKISSQLSMGVSEPFYVESI